MHNGADWPAPPYTLGTDEEREAIARRELRRLLADLLGLSLVTPLPGGPPATSRDGPYARLGLDRVRIGGLPGDSDLLLRVDPLREQAALSWLLPLLGGQLELGGRYNWDDGRWGAGLTYRRSFR